MTTSYDLGALKQPDEIGAGRDPREIILPQPGFKTVLANRDFRLIWSAQVASQLADKFLMFALLILTYSISRASTHGAALFLAYTFPSVFLSPLAGVYADRHDKKRLMFSTNAIRGGLILLIPLSQLVPYFEHVTWHLFLIIFLFASVGQIFAPAEAAAIPFIVGTEELMTATSMFTSTVIVTLLVAVPLSTLAVRFLGTDSPYWIAAALFLLAAWLIYAVKTDLHARTHQAVAAKTDILYELREGISYIVARPLVRFAVVQLSLTIAVIFSIFVLAPSYMSTVLHLEVTDVYLIPAFTVLQEKTEAELRGRIFGAMFTVVNAAVAIPILLAGGLADLFGVTWVIFGMGCLLAASGVISALAGRRSPLVPPTLSTNGKTPV